jgi:serine/threonine protein kinase HipA of HipAB toxin-antitoxin module
LAVKLALRLRSGRGFNILVGDTDDHARNHAAFWDGKLLELTPAYDICPSGARGLSPSGFESRRTQHKEIKAPPPSPGRAARS